MKTKHYNNNNNNKHLEIKIKNTGTAGLNNNMYILIIVVHVVKWVTDHIFVSILYYNVQTSFVYKTMDLDQNQNACVYI